MRASWRAEWPLWLLLGAQFLLAAVTWPQTPGGVATAWSGVRQAGGDGDRFAGLRLIPLVSLGLYLALLLVPRFDPRREGYRLFAGSYALIRFAVVAVMTATYGLLRLAPQGYQAPLARIVPLAIGALFLVIGTQLRHIRPGWLTGGHARWTLSGRASWTRTNRLTGWLMEGTGLLVMVAGLLDSVLLLAAAVAGTVLGAVGLAAFSYRSWAEDPGQDESPGANAA